MDTESRAAILRALRAYLDVGQAEVAEAAGIGRRTLWEAETGKVCSERTWIAMLGYYEARGLQLVEGDQPCIALPSGTVSITAKALVAQLRTQIDKLAALVDHS